MGSFYGELKFFSYLDLLNSHMEPLRANAAKLKAKLSNDCTHFT